MELDEFELLGAIVAIKTIAEGSGIRELRRLRKQYGPGNWRKKKGMATVRLLNGTIVEAEVHWYEAHGKGKRLMKIKRFLDE